MVLDMNKLVKTIILSVSASVIAVSAFAAPPDHHNPPKKIEPTKSHMVQHKPMSSVKPSRDWRAGQIIPPQYRNAHTIDYKKYSKLTKPGKNQHWIKVNGDYVLMNIVNHKIVKIIRG